MRLASTLPMHLFAQCALCRSLVAILQHLLSARECTSHYLEQPSASAMVWTCFLAIFPSLLGLNLPGGGSPYSMYATLVFPFSLWSRSSKHFLPHSCSSLKLPLWDASVPALDACNHCWLWQYHMCSVQCFAAAALASCLAQSACFRKALRTLFVHTDRTVVFPFRTSNVIRSVRSSHLYIYICPAWVGSRSPDGWDQIPRWAGGWVLHQPPWSFGFESQTRGTKENRGTLC
jgi:hypothetical protein